MSVTPSQLRVLRLLEHNHATRRRNANLMSDWTWMLDGKPEGGPIDRLLQKRLAETIDSDTVTITERGRRVLKEG
jgi:hypothetical protein